MLEAASTTLRIESLPPGEKNIFKYALDYGHQIRGPLFLQNHTQLIPYFSNEAGALNREAALAEYINGYMNPELPRTEDYDWGRTVGSEIAYVEMVKETYKPILEREGINVVLVPTDIDSTIAEVGPNFQKGVDNAFVQGNRGIYSSDVTINQGRLIRHKYDSAGVHANADMPASIVRLRNLVYISPNGEMKGFIHYMDNEFRKSVIENGRYIAFAGLSEADKRKWKKAILLKNKEAIKDCRASFELNQFAGLGEYTNMSLVNAQLDDMERYTDELLEEYKEKQAA